MQNKEKVFEEIYEQVVTEALSVLGEHVAGIIILYIHQKYSIRLIDTCTNPQALTEALKSALDGRTRIIQRRILRLLYQKLDIRRSFVITLNFEEKITEAKLEFEKRKKSEAKREEGSRK